jgi:hypothetical protein
LIRYLCWLYTVHTYAAVHKVDQPEGRERAQGKAERQREREGERDTRERAAAVAS